MRFYTNLLGMEVIVRKDSHAVLKRESAVILLVVSSDIGIDTGFYIGVDDAPAPLAEVVGWLREYLGVTEWSEDASVRRTGSKRCSNARARALGWTPQYSSYREGYAVQSADL